jgi:transglycosylase-like protein with SLT domain
MAVDASAPIAPGRGATAVTSAIRGAAQATGVSFNYLLATAKIESGLDPNMTMRSSSASGLFQFIDQTWLGTMKQAGPALGYGAYADAISRSSSGRYVVQDPEMRREIMRLRGDPTANATMAGVFTQQNAALLSKRIGRIPTNGELYIAHFLGPGGAGKLIEAAGNNPQATAADVFPQAARANRPIFYDKQGNARSVAGVYSELVRRYTVASNGSGTTLAGAAAHPTPPAAIPNRPAIDTAGLTRVFAAAAAPATTGSMPSLPAAAAQAGPKFNSLFSDTDRRMAVSPVVAALWSTPTTPLPANATQASSGPATTANNTTEVASFGLFQDSNPNVRGLFDGSSS